MRCWLLGCAASALAWLATPAYAYGPYIGAQGGLFQQQPLNYNFVGLRNFFSTRYRSGVDASVRAGYDFEGLRVEVEGSFRRAKANRFGFQLDGEPFATVSGSDVSGNVQSLSGVLNVIWDITQGPFRPYIGVGAGITRVSSHRVGFAGFGDSGIFLDSTDIAPVFQVQGGVQYRLTKRVFVHAAYRFSDVEKLRIGAFGAKASAKLRGSSVLLGFTFFFRSQSRPVELPRPPRAEAVQSSAPSVQPTSVQAAHGSFVLVFRASSSALPPEAAARLGELVQAVDSLGHASVSIESDADTSQASVYSDTLALARANSIRRYLTSTGVPADAITIQSWEPILKPAPAGPSTATATRIIDILYGLGSGQ